MTPEDRRRVVEAVIAAPREYARRGDVAIGVVLQDAGVNGLVGALTPAEVRDVLEADPEYVADWIRWSEDKRTSGGWFIQPTETQQYEVAMVDDDPRHVHRTISSEVFDDHLTAVATFIVHEVASLLPRRAVPHTHQPTGCAPEMFLFREERRFGRRVMGGGLLIFALVGMSTIAFMFAQKGLPKSVGEWLAVPLMAGIGFAGAVFLRHGRILRFKLYLDGRRVMVQVEDGPWQEALVTEIHRVPFMGTFGVVGLLVPSPTGRGERIGESLAATFPARLVRELTEAGVIKPR